MSSEYQMAFIFCHQMRTLRKYVTLISIILLVLVSLLIITLLTSHDVKYVINYADNIEINPPDFYSLYPLRHSVLESSLSSRWKVLKDGTVIHVGQSNVKKVYNHSYIVNNAKMCHSLKENQLSLIIFVESKVNHFEKRKAIRETWALSVMQVALNYRVVFMLALSGSHDNQSENSQMNKEVLLESINYNDIIQLDLIEHFRNITLKSIASLKWYLQFCSNANFALKTDDDIYIHVPNLVNQIEKLSQSERNNTIMCHNNRARKIIRLDDDNDPDGMDIPDNVKLKVKKYSVNRSELPGKYFPKYCGGFAYSFNLQVAHQLYAQALLIPYFFIEDVFITGFCREKVNIEITDNVNLTLRPEMTGHNAICEVKNGRITSNEISVQTMTHIWKSVNTQGFFCPKIYDLFKKVGK